MASMKQIKHSFLEDKSPTLMILVVTKKLVIVSTSALMPQSLVLF